MQISVLTSQKTSGGLGNLYVGDWKERKIRASTLYLVSHYFQGLDRGPVGFKKRS